MTNILNRLVGMSIGRGGNGDAVRTGGNADGGESMTTTAWVSVTAAGVARVTTSVATGVAFFGLVVLSDLDGLLDMVELNAYDSVLRNTVDWGRGTVVGRDAVGAVRATEPAGTLVLDLILQDDVLDFIEEMRVDVVAFTFLVSDGDRWVMSAATADTTADTSARDVWWGSGVAVSHWGFGSSTTQEGKGDLLRNEHIVV